MKIFNFNARHLTIALAAALPAFLTGCLDFSGGGWMYSVNSTVEKPLKATFGFNTTCTDTPDGAVLAGNLQYHDHGVIVPSSSGKGKGSHLAVQMDISDVFEEPLPSITCEEADLIAWYLLIGATPPEGVDGRYSVYCPQPMKDSSECGIAMFLVYDTGETGPDKGDLIRIELAGGKFAGYSNVGELQGGNISVGLPL